MSKTTKKSPEQAAQDRLVSLSTMDVDALVGADMANAAELHRSALQAFAGRLSAAAGNPTPENADEASRAIGWDSEELVARESTALWWRIVNGRTESRGLRGALELTLEAATNDLLACRYVARTTNPMSNAVEASKGEGTKRFRERAAALVELYRDQDEARAKLQARAQ